MKIRARVAGQPNFIDLDIYMLLLHAGMFNINTALKIPHQAFAPGTELEFDCFMEDTRILCTQKFTVPESRDC